MFDKPAGGLPGNKTVSFRVGARIKEIWANNCVSGCSARDVGAMKLPAVPSNLLRRQAAEAAVSSRDRENSCRSVQRSNPARQGSSCGDPKAILEHQLQISKKRVEQLERDQPTAVPELHFGEWQEWTRRLGNAPDGQGEGAATKEGKE
ncbi:hypothetical protein DFJ73DRAFT_766225 [Zopfochytrium polystomum]|nr:hypothetical protein DFJ73DRAFT_766225 [Zopfochytrium polystomum]